MRPHWYRQQLFSVGQNLFFNKKAFFKAKRVDLPKKVFQSAKKVDFPNKKNKRRSFSGAKNSTVNLSLRFGKVLITNRKRSVAPNVPHSAGSDVLFLVGS